MIEDFPTKFLSPFVPSSGTSSEKRSHPRLRRMHSVHLATYNEKTLSNIFYGFPCQYVLTWKTASVRWHISRHSDTSFLKGTWSQRCAFWLLCRPYRSSGRWTFCLRNWFSRSRATESVGFACPLRRCWCLRSWCQRRVASRGDPSSDADQCRMFRGRGKSEWTRRTRWQYLAPLPASDEARLLSFQARVIDGGQVSVLTRSSRYGFPCQSRLVHLEYMKYRNR